MAGKNKNTEKTSKGGDKNTTKDKGGNSKDNKANEANSSKLKPATAINARHILVRDSISPFILQYYYAVFGQIHAENLLVRETFQKGRGCHQIA